MPASLKSVDATDPKPVSPSDLTSPPPNLSAVDYPRPDPGGVERIAQRILESIRTERPEVVLEVLSNVRSATQQKINSPIGQRVTRNRRRGEAEVLKIPGSFLGIPKVTESVSASEEEGGSSHDPDDASSQNNDSDEGESDDEESSCTDDYTDAEPTYDEADDIYRCARPGCGWEVAFGYCHGCQTKYITEDDDCEAVDPRNPFTVFRKRLLTPRGYSPPPEPIPGHLRPLSYGHNPRIFDELISRGATLAFCETWNATFDKDRGIIVRANRRLGEAYETLIGEDGWWTIWVGRRIKLCDNDADGSLFMEDLLDLIFTEDDDGRWITYQKRGGFWVTRPKEGSEIPGMAEDVEDAEVAEVADEYDVWSEEGGDRESSIGSYAGEASQTEAEPTPSPATSDCESTWWSDDSENEAEAEEDEVGGGVQVDEARVEEAKDIDNPAL